VLILNRIKFFLSKPIHIRCGNCELRLLCLGGSNCIHRDRDQSWRMNLYLISVSAITTLLISSLMFWRDLATITKSYCILTWVSGSIWTVLFYNLFYYVKRRRRKREEERYGAS